MNNLFWQRTMIFIRRLIAILSLTKSLRPLSIILEALVTLISDMELVTRQNLFSLIYEN